MVFEHGASLAEHYKVYHNETIHVKVNFNYDDEEEEEVKHYKQREHREPREPREEEKKEDNVVLTKETYKDSFPTLTMTAPRIQASV